MPRPNSREKILDAAEQLLLAHGPTGLVLDAVAEEAGVSKGGLLYHFGSKEALAEGLTDRMGSSFDRAQEEIGAADPEAPGRHTRAYLRSTVGEDGKPADGSARLMAGILAALGGDPARLDALRERFAEWHRRLDRDGIDPVNATLVRLAADGLWLSELLGLSPLPPGRAEPVLEALAGLTREPTS